LICGGEEIIRRLNFKYITFNYILKIYVHIKKTKNKAMPIFLLPHAINYFPDFFYVTKEGSEGGPEIKKDLKCKACYFL
jgi:hypothetical protein